MTNYQDFYTKLSRPWRRYPSLIKTSNLIVTTLIYLLYPLVLGYWVYLWGLLSIAELVFYPALGFIMVTVVRKRINRPRPYETWEIEPLIAKDTAGQSLPSRHVFSAAVIGTVLLTVHYLLGILVLLLAIVLAFLRVIGGVHYPKDVIFGFLLGLLFGLPVLL